jgi:predicted phosphoribosyltransferase
VVLAVPVVAAAGEAELQRAFDEIITLEQAPQSVVLSDWYEHIEEVTDDSALQYLHRARIELPANHEGGELWNGEWIKSQAAGPTVKR